MVSDAVLADDEALVVTGLSKRQSDAHDARYDPAVSIVARLRTRSEGAALVGRGGGGGGDDDDDMDMDDDDDDEEESAVDRKRLGRRVEGEWWPLRNVSFSVRVGEAVGIVGDRAAIEVLTQILSQMTAPTEGRVVHRGRIGLSADLARVLTRQESHSAVRVLRMLSGFAGVPRAGRRPWASDGVALVGGDEPPTQWGWTDKVVRARLAIAAALDPQADVLLVDRFPGREDVAFRERCLARIRSLLGEGAAAVVTCPDVDAIGQLCERVVWLEKGSVASVGLAADVLERFRSAAGEEDWADYASVPSFNASVAIHEVELTTAGRRTGRIRGGDSFRVDIEIETARPETTVSCRLTLNGPTKLSLPQSQPYRLVAPGRYVATLRAPPNVLGEGDYRVRVDVVVLGKRGGRAVAARVLPGTLRVDADVDPGPTEADALAADWSIVGEPDMEVT